MVYFGAVQHACYQEILRLYTSCLDILVEDYAQLIAGREYSVAGLGCTHGLGKTHILDYGYLVAHACYLAAAVGACRDGAELVCAVCEQRRYHFKSVVDHSA